VTPRLKDAPASAEVGVLPDASQIIGELLAAVRAEPGLVDRIAGDAYLQQLVVHAFIEAELARLFQERNRWLALSEAPSTYEPAQTALKAQQAVRTALEVARDLLGMFELLAGNDPRAPANGALVIWEQAALVELAEDEQRAAFAAALGYPAPGGPLALP
jgi:alkylation response protein AidB-like acyl-CoA dehydrogenase